MAVPPGSRTSALQFGFRVHQECAGRNDAFSRARTSQDLYAIAEALADLYRARLQAAIPQIYEDSLPCAGVDDSIRRNRDPSRQANPELDIHEHIRLQTQVRIGRLQPDFQSARRRID